MSGKKKTAGDGLQLHMLRVAKLKIGRPRRLVERLAVEHQPHKTFELRSPTMDDFIETVVDGCLPKDETVLSGVITDVLKKEPLKKGQMNSLFHLCIRQVIKNRIRHESTAGVWFKLLYSYPLDIFETSAMTQDNAFLQPQSSLDALLQSIDRTAREKTCGSNEVKNNGHLMAKILEQNLDRAIHKNFRITTSARRCKVYIDNKMIVNAEHPRGVMMSFELAITFARIAFSKGMGFTDVEIKAPDYRMKEDMLKNLLASAGMYYPDDVRVADPEVRDKCTAFYFCNAGRRGTFLCQELVIGIQHHFECLQKAYFMM